LETRHQELLDFTGISVILDGTSIPVPFQQVVAMASSPGDATSSTLPFSLPAGDFERFMLQKERDLYTEKLPMTVVALTWNGAFAWQQELRVTS
jgi:hypothetical protein